ncbi:ATP-binding SpoIIE family protein phosphatase [Actinacidiphila glaucinigra]|uniref:ATP-binding SpoIIE family protein phosphatase n=1 Tax=Actinacidiphila glaucinigra TaxID=235986 RepID=UPI003672C5D4
MSSTTGTAASEAHETPAPGGAATALLDAEGTVAGWSQAAQRLVGYSAAEMVGRPARTLLLLGGDVRGENPAAEQLAHRGRWSGPARIRHRDGRGIDVHLTAQSLAGRNGRSQWLVSATETSSPPSWAAPGPAVAEPSAVVVAEPPPVAVAIPRRLPIGVAMHGTQVRCIWVNDIQSVDNGGVPPPQSPGSPPHAVAGAEAESLEAVMHRMLESGDLVINGGYPAFSPDRARQDSPAAGSLFRLDDAQGRALGVCAVSTDDADARRAQDRLRILDEAGKRIGTTLDVMRTGQELADLAVPTLADYATVDLAESVLLGGEPPARPGSEGGDRTPAVRRAGLASIRPGAPESLFARGDPVSAPQASTFTGVLRSGRAYLEPVLNASPGTWLDHNDAARAAKVREHRMHSLMLVPISARGAVLGVATFIRTRDPRPFDEDDLLLAEELVRRAATSVDQARQYAREHSAALALQRHLLPRHPTGGAAADVAWRYLPADSHHGVGGDWFDVIPLSGARVALVVGDVVGHGINAAATMGQLRTAVHTLADLDVPPDELLAALDKQVTHLAEADAGPGGAPAGTTMTTTFLYAVYDPVTRLCTMARAGHPPPAVVDAHGGVTFPDLPVGAPLGLGMAPFESVTLELPEGSVLALYTDGLIEDRDHDIDFGMDRLGAALAQPGLSLEELCSSAVGSLPAGAPNDDVTLLLARTRSLGPGHVASWRFPGDAAVVGHARSLVTRQLARWGLEHLAESTELIVSELVTNAIIHGDGKCDRDRTIGLRLIRHAVLTCEVSDTSHSHPLLHRPTATDEHGRGLFLVSQLSRAWGARHVPDGKLVWVDQQLTPGPGPAP